MSTCTVVVKYSAQLNCFVGVNSRLLATRFGNVSCRARARSGTCARLVRDGDSVVLWCVESAVADGCVSLNYLLARRLNIPEDSSIILSECSPPPAFDRVTISTDTAEDYEILETNMHKLQLCLLDQLKVLIENQKMVIWVSPSLSINIKAINSSTLKEFTEIEVIPPDSVPDKCSSTLRNEVSNVNKTDIKSSHLSNYMDHLNVSLEKYQEQKWAHIMKSILISEKEIMNKVNVFHNCLYVPSQYYNETYENSVFHLQVMSQSDESSKDNIENVGDFSFVKLKPFESENFVKNIKISSECIPAIVPDCIKNRLCMQSGDMFVLIKCDKESIVPEAIEISPVISNFEYSLEELQNSFKTFILSNSTKKDPLLVNKMDVINLCKIKNMSCQVKFYPKSLKYILIDCDTLRNCRIIVNNDKTQPFERTNVNQKQLDLDNVCRDVQSFNNIINNCIDILNADILMENLGLNSDLKNRSILLILGPSGSGKTTLTNIIVEDSKVRSFTLDCRSMKGRKDIVETFQKAVHICEEHAPSILVCDDIECAFPCEKEGLSGQDLMFFELQTNAVKTILTESRGVFVIMTGTGLDDIHSILRMTKGDIFFSKIFTIPELSQSEHVCLLKNIISNSLYKHNHLLDEDYYQITLNTVGFTVRDLVDYSIKNLFKSIKNSVQRNANLELTFDNTTSSNKDALDSNIWSEVGGLLETKEKLTQIIFWPIKYPALFSKQPGAILLYGAPGTGKSLIGGSVSKIPNVSFICVKGPELLSKYIGQSEQAVRNLFKRAEKKKPCIVFFDEFDSLAPRRGHDSTGVTDRVVNQLLTQLDGVEGSIKGVTVIAATSRPDLLDGALLRPGRFDTYIRCSTPNQDERLEIFKIFGSNLPLNSDVNFEELSLITDNYTGADIKAILSTAQLMCIEEKLALDSNDQDKSLDILITQKHLLDAMKETRPSLSLQQLAYYDKLYERFLNKPSINSKNQTEIKKQRATLA